jgi:hypothetical protein
MDLNVRTFRTMQTALAQGSPDDADNQEKKQRVVAASLEDSLAPSH